MKWEELQEELQRHREESWRKQEATLRKLGLAELDDDGLEEAGIAAGREWAHNQPGYPISQGPLSPRSWPAIRAFCPEGAQNSR
jgi:hypothetical protein